MIAKFKITDPNGVLVNGEIVPKGETVTADTNGSQARAWVRFKQAEQVKEEPEAEAKAKAEADAKKKAEAEAAKKAEAEAKAKGSK